MSNKLKLYCFLTFLIKQKIADECPAEEERKKSGSVKENHRVRLLALEDRSAPYKGAGRRDWIWKGITCPGEATRCA